jgi:hypothetical protein
MCSLFNNAQRKQMQELRTEAKTATRDRLRDIAKLLKIPNYSHMTKADLFTAIVNMIDAFIGENDEKESDNVNENTASTENTQNATQSAPNTAEGNYTTTAPESAQRAAQTPYSEGVRKTTDDFINELSDGSIIAVQIAYNKAVSVVVISHERDANNKVISCKCKGRDGTIYDVPRASIIWHKVNKRYPAWVYEKIKNGEGERYAKVRTDNME